MQNHPSVYEEKLAEESAQGISLAVSGGFHPDHEGLVDNDCDVVDNHAIVTQCKFLFCQNSVTHPDPKFQVNDWEFISNIFDKYRLYSTNIPLRILGHLVLIVHQWKDCWLISKAKKSLDCRHKVRMWHAQMHP